MTCLTTMAWHWDTVGRVYSVLRDLQTWMLDVRRWHLTLSDVDIWHYLTLSDVGHWRCTTFDVWRCRYVVLRLRTDLGPWPLTLTRLWPSTFDLWSWPLIFDLWSWPWPWRWTLTFDVRRLILMLIFYMTDCHDIMTYDELSYVNLSYDSVTCWTMTYWHILLLNKLYTFHKLNTNLNG
jgi:hypothetical protein